ncbi:hypothetical protein F5148DRAFT_593460 [Russula earlei]|uniref:Uncharacterized protein n=1 Tax=Russula earlei TaxID=71964 RepID=A0ACC0UGK7_9AGAM|nr:hypothetical protein F5148DRAFT_593460 [Russula earlei]
MVVLLLALILGPQWRNPFRIHYPLDMCTSLSNYHRHGPLSGNANRRKLINSLTISNHSIAAPPSLPLPHLPCHTPKRFSKASKQSLHSYPE